nr:putative ribonuclease H-like domain-containing protein [Tanacetum cinerariifolium]
MRRKERVTRNVLDAVIQVISLAIVQKHLTTKIKRLSLEVLGVIARMTSKPKPTKKLVSWLNRQISLKIINKNKILKTKRDLLEKEILELNEKIKKLEKIKEIEMTCKSCDEIKLENAKLKETQVKFVKFDKSANSLREMLSNQKSPSCKIGLGFNSDKASTSESKTMSFVGSSAKKVTDGSTIKGHRSTLPGSVAVCLKVSRFESCDFPRSCVLPLRFENDIKRMDVDDQAIQTILLGLPEDVYATVDSYINDPTEAMNSSLILFAKEFQLTAPTKNNQRTSSNPRNRQIAQQVQNVGVQNGGNQNGLIVVPGIANQNETGNIVAVRAKGTGYGNQARCYNCRGLGHIARNCTARPRRRDAAYLQTQLLIAQKQEPGIQLQPEEFDFMAAAGDLDEIEEVNANCILMANLQHASTSEQYTDLLEPISEPQIVPQNDNHVTFVALSMVQSGGTVKTRSAPNEETRVHQETVYRNLVDQVAQTMHMLNPKPDLFYYPDQKMALGYPNPSYLKKAQLKEQSLYNGNLLLEEHDPLAVYDSEETLELTQESREKMRTIKKEIKPANYAMINNLSGVFVPQMIKSKEELFLSNVSNIVIVSKMISIPNEDLSDDTTPSDARKFLNEIQFLQEAAKFVRDFKSFAKETDEFLDKQKSLELKIERLLKVSVNHDIMSIMQNGFVDVPSDLQTELDRTKEKLELYIIKKEKEYAVLWNNWYTKYEECKYDKLSYDKAYNNMQQKVKRLQAQLRDLKGKSSDTLSASNTLDPLNQKVETKIVELEFQVANYEREISHLKTTYKNLFDSISSNRAHAKLHNLMYENAKLRAQLFKNTSESMNNTSGMSVTPQADKPKLIAVTPYSKKFHTSIPSHSVPQPREFNVVNIENVSSDTVNASSTGLMHTARTRGPQPKGNTRNARVPSTSKSSEVKKNVNVEDHRRILLLSKNQKTMSSECNNIKLAIQNDKSEIVCGSKSKRVPHPPKPVSNLKQRLHLLHMDLCGPMRVASISGKRYVLVIVDDYSRYTWVYFLRTKDEMPEVIKNFLKMIFVRLQAPVIIDRIDNRTEFKNHALKEYFDSVGITHETSAAKTPQQNGVVERRNHTLVEASRTMLIFSHALLFLWAKAIATACYTQNRSIIHRRFNKTSYKLIQGRKPDISYLHVFGALFYPKNDHEDIVSLVQKVILASSLDILLILLLTKSPRTVLAASIIHNLQAPSASMSIQDSASIPTNSSSTPISLHNVDEQSQPHVQQQGNHTSLPTASAADDVPNAMFEGDLFVNPFAIPSTERFDDDILVVQVYVDDIIFGSTNPRYATLFSDLMKSRFEMSMMGEMTFFLGLQVNQSPSGTFINKSNYMNEILKKYELNTFDIIGTPMDIKDKLDLDQIGTPFDATKCRSMIGALMYLTLSRPDIVHATCDSGFELTGFLDAGYAGCKDTFKSTSGGAQFLGKNLVSWSSKKQDCTSLSTAESEYVSLFLWMQTQLTDYGYHFNKIPIYFDSKSAIAISCNPVQHSRTKHIAVRYHFIKEHVEKGTIELYFVKTDYQLANIFTKALPVDRFNYLVCRLRMRSLCPQELDHLAKLQ